MKTYKTKEKSAYRAATAAAAAKVAIISLCMFTVLTVPAYAAPAGEQGAQTAGLPEFLRETGMSFDEYISIVAEFEQEGIYTHYIGQYAPGYEWFMYNNPGLPESSAIAYVNVRSDFGAYSKIQDVPDTGVANLLVNKNHILPEDYVPEDLVRVSGTSHQMREEAALQFELMREHMREYGLNAVIISAYRSYSVQRRLHRNAISGGSLAGAEESVAREGHSEHQTGLAADILHRSYSGRLGNAGFQDTEEYAWMTQKAYQYGFILRYPEENADLHGYMYEPWHWRYVGVEIASAMHKEGITVYEEFYGKYLTPEVLQNTKRLIYEKQAAQAAALEEAEAERLALEAERLALEDAERKAAEDAKAQGQAAAIPEDGKIKAEQEALLQGEAERETISQQAYSSPLTGGIQIINEPAVIAVMITIVSFIAGTFDFLVIFKWGRAAAAVAKEFAI